MKGSDFQLFNYLAVLLPIGENGLMAINLEDAVMIFLVEKEDKATVPPVSYG